MTEDYQALILRAQSYAYAVADAELRVVSVRDAPGHYGPGGAGSVGRPLAELVPALAGCEPVLREVLRGELPAWRLANVNVPDPDGTTQYISMAVVPVRDASGDVVGLVHYSYDTSYLGEREQTLCQQRNDLKLIQDRLSRRNLELAAANAELQRLDDLKSTFVSVAAHELRAPLSSMLAYLELLEIGEFGLLTSEQGEAVDVVAGGANRLLEIIDKLLDLARIEAGYLELILKPTDLVELVTQGIIEMKPEFDARAHELRFVAAPDLPHALCDAARTSQVVVNLLSNACKYTPDGGLIEVRLARAAEPGLLHLSVADSGIGIPPEDQQQVFRRFVRGAGVQRSDVVGTGLGLSVTRALVDLHGGRIWLDSTPGEGSTFHVTLPTAD